MGNSNNKDQSSHSNKDNHNSSENKNTRSETFKEPIKEKHEPEKKIHEQKKEKSKSNTEIGKALGGYGSINICGLYAEHTTHDDYNIGFSADKSISKGNSYQSSGSYAELTFNKKEGFSVGAGAFAENGHKISKKINVKGAKVEVGSYESNYVAEDKFRKNLCCNPD